MGKNNKIHSIDYNYNKYEIRCSYCGVNPSEFDNGRRCECGGMFQAEGTYTYDGINNIDDCLEGKRRRSL